MKIYIISHSSVILTFSALGVLRLTFVSLFSTVKDKPSNVLFLGNG